MTYLLQIQTTDFALQLKTEVTAESSNQLNMLADKMVKANPEVKGMTYRVFIVIKTVAGKFDSKMVKEDRIAT